MVYVDSTFLTVFECCVAS